MSVAAPMDGPKETGGRNINNLVHNLRPKQFYQMFTTGKCTYEEKVIRNILECICALRNSGGGKLTLWFSGTYSESQANWCIDYIKKAVEEVLLAKAKIDLEELKLPHRVTFLIKSSKEIVTMKYNVMTNKEPMLVPSTTSAAEVRAHSHHSKKPEQRDVSHDYTETDPQPVQETSHMTKETPALRSRQVVELVKGQDIWNTQLLSHEKRVAFNRLEKNEEKIIISNREKKHLLDFTNHGGGRWYYGISSDGKVCGEEISEQEKEALRREVKKKIELILQPKDDKKIGKISKITFLPVTDRHSHKLYVIEIHVKSCSGVLVEKSLVYYLGEYGVEKMPFSDWNASFRDSTRAVPDTKTIIEFETTKEAFELCFLPKDYTTILKSLDWVESCSVVDKEKCDAPHLEIVCKFGKVPCTADIVNYVGEEILPFITYQEGSKREWFETNIFDEFYDMKEEYDDKLLSFSWVKDYYIGVAIKPEKSWQIYITCAKNEVPRMDELKELFGVNIGYFVHFIKESVDEDACSSSCLLLRGPVAGDHLLVEKQQSPGSGTVGILVSAEVSDEVKHYATTCYHVCYQKKLSEHDPGKQHRILMDDFKNNAQECRGVNYEYTNDGNRDLLGNFAYGLYNDYHDIALVELEKDLDCTDAIEFLNKRGITLSLANRKAVKDAFYDKVPYEGVKINGEEVPGVKVTKIGSETGVTTGLLYALSGPTACERYKRCYRVVAKKGKIFAGEGDSGSLVYLETRDKEKIPFGYLCMAVKSTYYCRNLFHSLEAIKEHHHELNNINPFSRNPNAQE